MDERTLNRLRRLDRVLRPRAAALRSQAHVAAQGNDRTHELREAIDRQAAELAGLRADVAALTSEMRTLTAQGAATSGALQPALERVAQASEAIRAKVAPADDRNERYDRWTSEIIERVLGGTDGTALDVGAHEGLILREIVAAAPRGRHHAFEPLPEQAAFLRREFADVVVHEVAVSDAEGEAEFHHVTTKPQFSGLRLRSHARDDEAVSFTVRTARLDDLVADDVPVRLIKIDVEGGEMGVLRGAARILGRHRPVTVFEFGLGGAGLYLTDPEDLLALFDGHGMAVRLLDDYLAGRPPLTRARFLEQYRTGENYYFVAS